MENLDRDKLKKEETCLIAPCGIYCGACDPFLEKSKCHAKELHRIIKGFNIADISSFTMGIEQERMINFLNILEQMSQANKCPGCLNGGGNPECPIKVCAKKLGYLTCAECDKMPCHISEQGSGGESMEAPFFLEMITKRYANWNIENLKRVREVGYRKFVDEMQEKVKSGFLTSDVISSDMVVTEAIEKMNI